MLDHAAAKFRAPSQAHMPNRNIAQTSTKKLPMRTEAAAGAAGDLGIGHGQYIATANTRIRARRSEAVRLHSHRARRIEPQWYRGGAAIKSRRRRARPTLGRSPWSTMDRNTGCRRGALGARRR